MTNLIKFAAACAVTEITTFGQASTTPCPRPCEGMWQGFREDFPSATDSDWNLVTEIYAATVNEAVKQGLV